MTVHNQTDSHAPYIPSPEEIAAACKEIRENWTDGERRNRVHGGRPPPKSEPAILTREIATTTNWRQIDSRHEMY